MNETKRATPDTPIQPLLTRRWSPYAFADRAVAERDLLAILEAARWSPSSYNEQPWRYLIARRTDADAFARLLSCLVEGNQVWAGHAPILMIGVTMLRFARNSNPNKAAHHDLGLASANLSVEATARGLLVHQMIGIVPERVRALFQLPEDAEPLTGIALGYPGTGDGLPEALIERDRTARSRRPVEDFVFENAWGHPAAFRRT